MLRYLKRVKTVENADGNLDIESQCMKALIYPAESGENKYEEYFYWDESCFSHIFGMTKQQSIIIMMTVS